MGVSSGAVSDGGVINFWWIGIIFAASGFISILSVARVLKIYSPVARRFHILDGNEIHDGLRAR